MDKNQDDMWSTVIFAVVILALGAVLFAFNMNRCSQTIMCSPSERIAQCGAHWEAQTYQEGIWVQTSKGTEQGMRALCGME